MKRILNLGIIGGLIALLSSCATAPPPPAQGTPETGSSWTLIVFLVVIFAIFYFLMVRPQRKRAKDREKQISSLQAGDNVITIGGIYGRIESMDDQSVVLKTEGGNLIRVSRQGIGGKRA